MSGTESTHTNPPGLSENSLEAIEGAENEGPEKTKFINENDTVDDKKDLDGSPESGHENKKGGRRKINIEFIENKSRRHVTFSKRKAGLIKKAYELSTLTGTQVLLLVASETGNVYTFATPKLQPLITKPEGKTLIQSCLNPPDQSHHAQPPPSNQQRMISQEPGMYQPEKKERMIKEPIKGGPPSLGDMPSFPNSSSGYPGPSSNPNNLISPNPSVMYSYSMSSMGPFVHPSSRVGPNPYNQFPNPGHSYPGSGQYPGQMQGQQQPPNPHSGYPYMGYSSSQSNPSFSSHEGGTSPRHND